MINGTLTPTEPNFQSAAWGEMINSKNLGKVYKITNENYRLYRFITLGNGNSLFIQLDANSKISNVEHAEKHVWGLFYFIPTGETITLAFK